MASRKLQVEENTKYIPAIYNIVDKKTKEFYVKIFFNKIFIIEK
jgi:hypothetical protein